MIQLLLEGLNKMKIMNFILIMSLSILLMSCETTESNSVELKFKVNRNEKFQTIEGFGASGAWWSQFVGGWEERDEIAELLFSVDNGIGLNIYRYNIGAGGNNIFDPWRRTNSIEIEEGVYNWERDENAIWFALKAQSYGADKIIAFINSPPPRLTINNLASGNQNGSTNISSENYQAFAEWGIGITEYLKNEVGLNIISLSPINEPQWRWGGECIDCQEGSHYRPNEVIEVLLTFKREMEKRGIATFNLVAPEAGEWKTAMTYANLMFENEELDAAIDAFDGHSYWSSRDDKIRFASRFYNTFPNKKLHMSEWTEMVNGRDTSMSSAITMANEIHDDLTILNVVSWQYWIAVSKYDYRDGLIYVSPLTQSITETKRLWSMGNFSKFVRPGFVRIGIEDISHQYVNISAYEKDNKIVIVIVNPLNTEMSFTLESVIDNLNITNINIYETSDLYDLMDVTDQNMNNNQIIVNGKSVTTLEITTG